MSRAVYIGGFGGGRSSTERVANALGDYYEDVEAFRFSELSTNPDSIRRASAGANLITHSAGALALKLESMNQVSTALLLGPPLPQRVSQLLCKTVTKTLRMNTPGIGIHELKDVGAVANYSASSLAELTVHPRSNLGRLPEIARTNTLDLVAQTQIDHTPTMVVWTDGDAYFRPSPSVLYQAQRLGARTITDIAGEHDEVILRPDQFLAELYEN